MDGDAEGREQKWETVAPRKRLFCPSFAKRHRRKSIVYRRNASYLSNVNTGALMFGKWNSRTNPTRTGRTEGLLRRVAPRRWDNVSRSRLSTNCGNARRIKIAKFPNFNFLSCRSRVAAEFSISSLVFCRRGTLECAPLFYPFKDHKNNEMQRPSVARWNFQKSVFRQYFKFVRFIKKTYASHMGIKLEVLEHIVRINTFFSS